jgi:hypothetical protein
MDLPIVCLNAGNALRVAFELNDKSFHSTNSFSHYEFDSSLFAEVVRIHTSLTPQSSATIHILKKPAKPRTLSASKTPEFVSKYPLNSPFF